MLLIFKKLKNYLFPHKHQWETRGQNRWFITTYRVCIKCGEAQERVNKSNEKDKFEKCNPIFRLDQPKKYDKIKADIISIIFTHSNEFRPNESKVIEKILEAISKNI